MSCRDPGGQVFHAQLRCCELSFPLCACKIFRDSHEEVRGRYQGMFFPCLASEFEQPAFAILDHPQWYAVSQMYLASFAV